MFADRHDELRFLDHVARRRRPARGELVLLYGRRRVGKSRLLAHWAEVRGLPHHYWVADREPAPLQRRKLFAALSGLRLEQAPSFASWGELWDAATTLLAGRRHVLILDELPYVVESDAGALSALQQAWDRRLKELDLILILCGSHLRTMEGLFHRQSPLFGRMTSQWQLRPLPFGALAELFPRWSVADRVEAWAVVGGVPAYLEWLDPAFGLRENLAQVVLSPGSMFVAEPRFLLYDEVRDPGSYLAVLRAVGAGARDHAAIARASMIDPRHLSIYLARLQELKLLARAVPATIAPGRARLSRRGRYHLEDAYFRFYFRFVAARRLVSPADREALERTVLAELDAFVGATAFEDLARAWVDSPAGRAALPFRPEQVGAHWERDARVDIVAPDFRARRVLVGECRWTAERVGAEAVTRLFEHTAPAVLSALPRAGRGWIPVHVFFARSGFTAAAAASLRKRGGIAVDLAALDRALALEP